MARILMEPLQRALVVEAPHRTLQAHLEAFGMTSTWVDAIADEGELIKALQQSRAQVLFKRSRVEITRNVVEQCPDLYAVQLCCIGTESVDLEACAERGILVFNDPVSNGRSVVEMAIGHMIALSRRLYETSVEMQSHQWAKSDNGRYEVRNKQLGIVGMGNIGRSVARIARDLGMEVAFHETRPVAIEVGTEMGYEHVPSLSKLFRMSDIVTAHASAKDAWGNDNAGILDPVLKDLGADRPENSPRVFLNLARGNLHTADSLLAAVKSGAVRRAAVDVYPDEPAPGQKDWKNPYAGEPRIACTPHIGAATQEAQPRIARHVAQTIESLSRYGSIRDCVFDPRAQMSLRDNASGNVVLAVVHSTSRGTKKAVDDAIFSAEASNLGSTHRDFDVGVAYDLSLLDRPLSREELERLAERSIEISQDPQAVKVIRQIVVPAGGW